MVQLFSPPKMVGKYVSSILRSGWLTTGPTCVEFKKRLGEFLKVSPSRICLASSATAGFQGIIDLLAEPVRETQRFECYITDATWPGLRHILRNHRWDSEARVHFNPGGRGVLLRNIVSPNAAVLTSIGGASLIDDEKMVKYFQDNESSTIIHDACHSWMLEWWADWTFMSLYPTKLVPGAEGGVVVAPTEADARELDLWLYCGLEPGSAGRGTVPAVPGRKANMTDVQAALGMEALELAPQYIEGIQESWQVYAEMATWRQIPYRGQPHRAYLFQIEVPSEKVPAVRKELERLGVPSAWNFRPAGLVTIPLYPNMSKTVQSMVLYQVERVLTECDLRGPISAPPPQ